MMTKLKKLELTYIKHKPYGEWFLESRTPLCESEIAFVDFFKAVRDLVEYQEKDSLSGPINDNNNLP